MLLFAFAAYISINICQVMGVNGYEIIAVYGSTPIIDGIIGTGEWDDASSISFNFTKVFLKQNGVNLFIAFNISDADVQVSDAVVFYLDVEHDGGMELQLDDIAIGIFRNGTLIEGNVTGVPPGFDFTDVSNWTASSYSTTVMWQAELNITYSKIDVIAGFEKTVGVLFMSGSPPTVWPPNVSDFIWTRPSEWGDITSTGYDWIPEFPSLIILPLFMTATLLAALIFRRNAPLRLSNLHPFFL